MNERKTFIIGEPSVPYDWEKDTAVYWPNRKRAEYEDAYWEPMGTPPLAGINAHLRLLYHSGIKNCNPVQSMV